MKSLSTFLLFAFLLLGSGCFPLTEMVRKRAEGYTRVDKKTHDAETIPGNPAYYALAPLSVPADIAVMPLWLLTFGVWMAAGFPGFTGH